MDEGKSNFFIFLLVVLCGSLQCFQSAEHRLSLVCLPLVPLCAGQQLELQTRSLNHELES